MRDIVLRALILVGAAMGAGLVLEAHAETGPPVPSPGELSRVCDAAKSVVGDCACVVGFLRGALPPYHALIMLEAWRMESDDPARSTPAAFHDRHGAAVIEAVLAFMPLKGALEARCPLTGLVFDDADPAIGAPVEVTGGITRGDR